MNEVKQTPYTPGEKQRFDNYGESSKNPSGSKGICNPRLPREGTRGLQTRSEPYFESSKTDEISVTTRVDENSPWFSGHFPDNPILPGVAQLSMIFEVIRNTVRDKLKISKIQRVRFKQIVRPGDELELLVKPVSGNSYSFRIMLNDKVACSGSVTAVIVE